jgi:hypothetical protein
MGRKIIFLLILHVFIMLVVFSHGHLRTNQNGDVVSQSIYQISRGTGVVAASFLWLRMDYYLHTSSGSVFNEEILPLLELVIKLDPTFIDAYTQLAFQLATYSNQVTKGVELLHQGIEKNKKSTRKAELYGQLGMIEFIHNQNTTEAMLAFNMMLNNYSEDCDLENFRIHLMMMKKILEKEDKEVPLEIEKTIRGLGVMLDNLTADDSIEGHENHDDHKQIWQQGRYQSFTNKVILLFLLTLLLLLLAVVIRKIKRTTSKM